MKSTAFLQRVLEHLPRSVDDFVFVHWPHEDHPFDEALGVIPVPAAVDPDRVIACAMDLDHYVGRIPHVAESRVVPDARFSPPAFLRAYQRASIPLLKDIHHETARVDGGVVDGFRCAYWNLLEEETSRLSTRKAARSRHHSGVWLARPGLLVYGMSSVPRREDLGLVQWKALVTGAAKTAPRMIRGNLDAMVRWSQER